MRGETLQRRERGYYGQLFVWYRVLLLLHTWPMPPEAPSTQALTIVNCVSLMRLLFDWLVLAIGA